MFKKRLTRNKKIFRKKKQKNFNLNWQDNILYFPKYTIFKLKPVINWLKKNYRKFKKRSINLYIYFNNNIIRTYKSKNARMGNGKGGIRRYAIFHKRLKIGAMYNKSKTVSNKLKRSFITKI